ncbi:MAG: tRNA (adenosine(37)-N6)-dimethylallyltransferase MiaA [Lactobacillales bacterium]|jgi:tRNA dimethylallyltransferase|nr:tRNA (adenosine(37)-N6)-dimethylallyltransferase MiaA [Lactobacillales bacterium]
MKHVIVIAGPTAGGKSKIALDIAKREGRVLINADSMQVYRDLRVLTARPTIVEEAEAPHYLYGYLDAHAHSSMADWVVRAGDVIKNHDKSIVVGGTGMYLDALMNGISAIPDVPADIREKVRGMDMADVRAQVQECTAVDDQRLRRALEVQLATGRPLAYFQALPRQKVIEASWKTYLVMPPRDVLYQRINTRFEKMMASGAAEEVAALRMQNPTGGVTKAIGYFEIKEYLAGHMTKEAAAAKASQLSRNYAKRQMTWFRHQFQADHILTDA